MFRHPLAACDWLLALGAIPFGARLRRAGPRYAMLLALYAAIYASCLLCRPGFALAALGLGYAGVLAMGRAWAANETRRSKIAKKLADGNPDELPDLRGAALVSALQLAILFPLVFQQLQGAFQLYRVPANTTLLTWSAFTFDSFCKMFVNFAEIYDVSFTRIEYASTWGRHLVLLKRLTFEYLLIQGVLRLLDIRGKVREAVAAIRQDVDLAVRLGRRAVPALLRLLDDPDPILRRQAARALGLIGDAASVEPLRRRLNDERRAVREAVAQALGDLGDAQAVEPLIAVLQKDHSDKIVLFHDRRQAAEALGQLGDSRAIQALTRLLRDGNGETLVAARRALARLHDSEPLAGAISPRG